MESLIDKLDLDGYIKKFKSFFAREKAIHLEGDSRRHFNFIKALSLIDFNSPSEIKAVDETIFRLKRQAVLKLDEIYTFVKIINYFEYLKSIEFDTMLKEWFYSIDIPSEIEEIRLFFTEDGEINLNMSEELFNIFQAIERSKRELRDALIATIHSRKMRDFMVDSRVHLYDGEESLLVRGGFLQVIEASIIGRSEGGFFYIVPKSVERVKAKEEALKAKRDDIVWRYQKRFSTILHKWVRFLEYINREFDRFDHYQARVKFAKSFDYEFILPSKGEEVILSEFAHPAIARPVLIDIKFSKSVMLITGVNAGGKSVLLKSILSAIFMSKYLLPFRCNRFKTKVGNYKEIEAIIDDPQSVKNDISTFAGRMVEFSKLFRKRGAIVGVDEVELGTDSDEASSLFKVLLADLKKRGIKFIITTHHKRLASLMAGDDDVELVAALYDEKNRVPTYKFLQGSIGKSYAFETAWRYGIPATVIERAKKFFGEDKERLNELIERSTIVEAQMRAKIGELEERIESVKRKERDIDELRELLKSEHKKSIFELEKSYREARAKALDALKEVEVAKARRLLNQAHKIKKGIVPTDREDVGDKFKKGDRVIYRGRSGTIISLKSRDALILLEGVKMRVPFKDLRLDRYREVSKVKVVKRRENIVVEKSKKGSVSLKLLGKRVDEALDEVDDFISNALLHGFSEIEIIHGIGSGVLSKAVSAHLKNHPKVKSFSKMEGNMGVTVVNL